MKLNNTTRGALNWCLLLETRMTEDIDNILGKGIWHKFTFTNQISVLNASRAYNMLYKKVNKRKLRMLNSKWGENTVKSAQNFTIEYHQLDLEKIYASALNPFEGEYDKYRYLLNLDLDNEEFVTLTYADAEPLQVSAKTSKYTEYNNFWKQIGVNT
jgi:hypothetical protein